MTLVEIEFVLERTKSEESDGGRGRDGDFGNQNNAMENDERLGSVESGRTTRVKMEPVISKCTILEASAFFKY